MKYPESAAGGYTRVDGTVEFYQRVAALLTELRPGAVVVDFGAGRGQAADDPVPYRRSLRRLQGPNRTVYGVDVDPAVLTNPLVDERVVIEPSGPLPFKSAEVDLLVADFVLEHVDDPRHLESELSRVMRPGGWVCARTPNRWGYIALAARLVPNALHVAALRRLQPQKAAEDTFPTRYVLNTKQAVLAHFATNFEVRMHTWDSEASAYAGNSRALRKLLGTFRLAPSPLRSMWFIYMQRRPT